MMKTSEIASKGMTLAQIGQVVARAVVDKGGSDEDTKTVINDRGLCDEIAELILKRQYIVIVDRSISPTYPSWVKHVLYPELENTGPSRFDVRSLDRWLHPDQKNGIVNGSVVHSYIRDNRICEEFLGLRDLEEIQKRGVAFFRKHFKGNTVFGLKSVIQEKDCKNGDLRVPCLVVFDDVFLSWESLDYGWDSSRPALRFAK